MTDQMTAHAEFTASDADWGGALVAHFGSDADALHFRYTNAARGADGTALRAAYDRRAKAHDDWLAALNMGRAHGVAK